MKKLLCIGLLSLLSSSACIASTDTQVFSCDDVSEAAAKSAISYLKSKASSGGFEYLYGTWGVPQGIMEVVKFCAHNPGNDDMINDLITTTFSGLKPGGHDRYIALKDECCLTCCRVYNEYLVGDTSCCIIS